MSSTGGECHKRSTTGISKEKKVDEGVGELNGKLIQFYSGGGEHLVENMQTWRCRKDERIKELVQGSPATYRYGAPRYRGD